MTPCMFIIRHGHRSDHGTLSDKKSLLKTYDPHLTQIGVQQSFFSGENLSKELQNKRVLLFCSPFRRCLETLESLINGLQMRHTKIVDNIVYVEDALREHQCDKIFDMNDFEKIHFFEDIDPLIHLPTIYNRHPIFKDFRHETTEFPESDETLSQRCELILNIMEKFLALPENEDVVPILLTHGFFTTELYRIFEKKTVNRYIYCSTSKLGMNEGGKLEPIYLDKKMY